MVNGEKEFYSYELSNLKDRYSFDIFVWGEELANKKLIVYPKRVKDLYGYENLKDRLKPCGVVLIDKNKKEFLHCTSSTIDIFTGNIYFSEEMFNGAWKILRNSVNIGIKMAKEKNMPVVSNPEDIVDLDNIIREGSIPVIDKKTYKIKYVQKELSEEERYKNSRKQSLLDNPKMFYFYSDREKYFHDKDCEEIKKIPPDEFCASETVPDKVICPKCARKVYFRKACYPNTRQILICDRIFLEHKVAVKRIRYFVMKAGMKFHATTREKLMVECREDKWIIDGLRSDEIGLWHNNYIRTGPAERYITQGYHKQKTEAKTLCQMLEYIENYSFEKHLKHEAQKGNINIDLKNQHNTEEITDTNNNIKWYVRVYEFIKKIFK